jgi:hypothetical protein
MSCATPPGSPAPKSVSWDDGPALLAAGGIEAPVTATLLTRSGVGLVTPMARIVAFCYLDNLGRRPLCIIGTLGIGAS